MSTETNVTYKIKEGDGNKDVSAKVIVKEYQDSAEFTLADMEMGIAYLTKTKKEIEAELGVKKATMANVEGTHPHVAQMTNEDLTAAYLYREASGFNSMAEEKLKEIEAQLARYEEEKSQILKDTGVEYAPVEITTITK
jgi:hypothetical protein